MIYTRGRASGRHPTHQAVSAITSQVASLAWPVGFALVMFVLTTHSPIGEWAEQNLSMHMMVQHPLNIIPGLILGRLAAPLVGYLRPSMASAARISSILLAIAVLAFWHLPATVEAAMHDDNVHGLMHVSMFLLVGAPLAVGLTNLGGTGRLLLLAGSVPISLLATIIPYSATDLYPSYAPWQHIQMAWLMMVVMPLAGIAALVFNVFSKPLARLWFRYRLYELGTICMAMMFLTMLTLEIFGFGHFHILH